MPIAYSLDLRKRVISLCKQYSKEEVAEMLDIHAATVYRYLKRFIEDNTLWIIDYKTSHMKTDNTQSFFNDQFTLHKNQLSSYVHALKPLFPIRTRIALYYPLIQEWFECTELLMHNTSSLKA